MSAPAFDAAHIPADLRDLSQFVAWRYEDRDGKLTKIPINVRTGRLALTNAPSTWATLEEAIPFARANGYGIGFVFAASDPFTGVDLDKCIDAETNLIAPWAWEIAAALDSYTEVSPSGTGLHCFVRAALPPGGKRKGAIEMYDRLRFFTLTGLRLPDLPADMPERQAQLSALHASIFPPTTVKTKASGPTPMQDWDDAEIVRRAMSAANGQKFSQLWMDRGHGYTSESEADAALCSMLAFWIGPDPERLDQLFRQSGRMRPKWERASYRDKTIALALSRGQFYEPRTGAALGRRSKPLALSFAKKGA